MEKSIADNFRPLCFTPPILANGWLDQFERVASDLRREDRRLFDDIPIRKRPTATGGFGGEWGMTHGGGVMWFSPADIKALHDDVSQHLQRLNDLRTRFERWAVIPLALLGLGIYLTYCYGYLPLPFATAGGITVAVVAAWVWRGWSIALPLRTLVVLAIKKAFGLV